jgi:hypothetical protein
LPLSWFQIWTICWQLAIFLTPLIMGGCVLWMRSQFVTKTDATAEKNRVDARFDTDRAERGASLARLNDGHADHETRLRMVEADVARPSSRHALNNAISTMQGGLHAVERGVSDMRLQMESQGADMRRQMDTLNGYLHTMIEKHLG